MTRLPRHAGDRRRGLVAALVFDAGGFDPDSNVSAAPDTTVAAHETSDTPRRPPPGASTRSSSTSRCASCGRTTSPGHGCTSSAPSPNSPTSTPPPADSCRTRPTSAPPSPPFGEHAGTVLTELLRQHILIAADLVAAANAGDDAEVTTQSELWYANADEIAQFLADANPLAVRHVEPDDAHSPRPDADRGNRPPHRRLGRRHRRLRRHPPAHPGRPTLSPTASSPSSPTASRPDTHAVRPLRRREPRRFGVPIRASGVS